jgi:hypothetical protein
MNIVQIIDYGLVGDSSLYTKRPNKKRTRGEVKILRKGEENNVQKSGGLPSCRSC